MIKANRIIGGNDGVPVDNYGDKDAWKYKETDDQWQRLDENTGIWENDDPYEFYLIS